MERKPLKIRLAQFGRLFALMCNRAMMYEKSHPVVAQSIEDVMTGIESVLADLSPVVFILNRDQFYVDEEPLDPRINVARVANWFKTNNIQSVSFEEGLTQKELAAFAGIFIAGGQSDTQIIKETLSNQGVFHIKVNHVVYKKVSEDDQIVSRETLKMATPLMEAEDLQDRRRFMETLMESVLTEEFAKTLNITSLMTNPARVSENMIAADLAVAPGGTGGVGGEDAAGGNYAGAGGVGSAGDSAEAATAGVGVGGRFESASGGSGRISSGGESEAYGQDRDGIPGGGSTASSGAADGLAAGSGTGVVTGGAPGHGHLLLKQIEVMQQEVTKHLQGQGDVALADLAAAVFDMKKQLLEGIQAQKAMGIAYDNEAEIQSRADELTDQVLLELIREEYQAGRITTARLAYLVKRLVPEADELKRLLPRIKAVLIAEGMPLDEYMLLLKELGNELQSDDLVRVLQESFEAIGVDGQELIDDIKSDPALAAKLMYMASEIRKGGGNEAELANVLVDYIEDTAGRMLKDSDPDSSEGEGRLKKMMTGIESEVLGQLSRLNVNQDALVRMEQRLNERMDAILDNMRVEWLTNQTRNRPAGRADTAPAAPRLTVLQFLQQHAGGDEELAEILEGLRCKADAGEIEENNYSQIHAEISRQKELLKRGVSTSMVNGEVLNSDELMFVLEKEIARTKRYNSFFSALGLSLISAKPLVPPNEEGPDMESIVEAMLEFFVSYFREVDIIGRIGKNKFVVLLPTIDPENGKKALGRILRQFHARPMDVHGTEVEMRMAGVVTGYDEHGTPDATAFAKLMVNQLTEMVTRVKNIQVLF